MTRKLEISADERTEFWRRSQANREKLASTAMRERKFLRTALGRLPGHPTKPTLDQLEEWIHDAVCNICGKTKQENGKELALDHNHATNEFRGFLCDNCNRLLGHANDSKIILAAAIEYLNDPPARSFL